MLLCCKHRDNKTSQGRGLLPGSFLGGMMGLNLAGSLLGTPVVSGVLSRLIVAGSMVLGVMVAGIMFITASATLG